MLFRYCLDSIESSKCQFRDNVYFIEYLSTSVEEKPSEDTLQDSITRGECIMSIIGNFKWLIDLLVYLNQELLQLIYVKIIFE